MQASSNTIQGDPFYQELEAMLGLTGDVNQYFGLLWSEGFTTPELLSEVTADDLKELNISLNDTPFIFYLTKCTYQTGTQKAVANYYSKYA